MSNYHSDKCNKEELKTFKKEVIFWLNVNFPNWGNKYKIKAFICYDGDVRLYDGTFMEIQNTKSSFRRGEAEKDSKGNITGYYGTRGKHNQKYINYISINRSEFSDIKNALNNPQNDNYYFYEDLIFRNLK